MVMLSFPDGGKSATTNTAPPNFRRHRSLSASAAGDIFPRCSPWSSVCLGHKWDNAGDAHVDITAYFIAKIFQWSPGTFLPQLNFRDKIIQAGKKFFN